MERGVDLFKNEISIVLFILNSFLFQPSVTFISGALATISGQTLRRVLRPSLESLHSPSSSMRQKQSYRIIKPIYNFLGWIMSQTAINYSVGPFQLLTFRDSMKLWSSVNYIVHFGFLFIIVGGRIWRSAGQGVKKEILEEKKEISNLIHPILQDGSTSESRKGTTKKIVHKNE